MEKFIHEMTRLYAGKEFRVYGHENMFPIHPVMNSEVSDLPTSHKIEGLASFSSKVFMCPQCDTPSYYLADPRGFKPEDFKLRDPWRYIKYAYRARTADESDKKEICERRGVSWSGLNSLPGWLTSINSVVEFMHCVYLCMVKHLTKVILLRSGMLNPIPRNDWYPLDRLEEFFSRIIWPVSVARLPPSVMSSSAKADQWRLHISVLFVGLFVAWEVDGILPDIEAPKSRSGTKDAAAQAKTEKVLHQRHLEILLSESPDPNQEQLDLVDSFTTDWSIRRHYSTMLEFSAAIQILSSRSISPHEVERGCAALSRACQNWANLGVHLTPYFHFAQHFQRQMLQFGPCYATWAFLYERNNGFLGRTNHNNHKGGELECTMMHKWWKWVLVHDLISLGHFAALADSELVT
ncbi:hypothetical protein DFH29DRAFT_980680 [Suillus ampliporus]|nr:hypothetical protein DFH29DRAFT_980680 [Suillus ampliporus]